MILGFGFSHSLHSLILPPSPNCVYLSKFRREDHREKKKTKNKIERERERQIEERGRKRERGKKIIQLDNSMIIWLYGISPCCWCFSI